MFIFVLLRVVFAQQGYLKETNTESCNGSPYLKVNLFECPYFPPPGNVLAFIFQSTLLSPISPTSAIFHLYGTDGSAYSADVNFNVQPIPGMPLDFGFTVKTSNANYVGYKLLMHIVNGQEEFGCYTKYFGIWRNI